MAREERERDRGFGQALNEIWFGLVKGRELVSN